MKDPQYYQQAAGDSHLSLTKPDYNRLRAQRLHTSEASAVLQIPIYAHVKELTDPQTGRRTALEVNYCKFLAYNGSYKLFGWIYIGEVGCRRPSYLFVVLLVSQESLMRTSVFMHRPWECPLQSP